MFGRFHLTTLVDSLQLVYEALTPPELIMVKLAEFKILAKLIKARKSLWHKIRSKPIIKHPSSSRLSIEVSLSPGARRLLSVERCLFIKRAKAENINVQFSFMGGEALCASPLRRR